MADLLLELFSEEIPARMQRRAGADLDRLMRAKLADAGYDGFEAKAFHGPRRLTFAATGLPERQADTREERKGPRVGAPDKAVEGFLRGAGLSDVTEAQTREDKKGAFYVAVIEREGRATADVIAEAIPEIVRAFPWPKSMRWGGPDATLSWVRPLRRVLCVFGGEVVPFTIENGEYPLTSGDVTEGHRFIAPGTITARDWEAYADGLARAHVVLDADERRERIASGARALCQAQNLELVEDDALLAETAGLAEWPVARIGTFEEKFLALPDEVLTASMRGHQKYFSVRDPQTGRLAPRFVTVANVEPEDGGSAMMTGYERVLTARLSDGLFLFEQDKKRTLAEHAEKLSGVTFFEGLGTVAERVNDLRMVALEVATMTGADAELVELASDLSKADLTTEMVGEFPELQGVMGRYYAQAEGLPRVISDALRDHYRPIGQGGDVPTELIAICVAIGDRVQQLAAFWTVGEKPTGSKDPFALRRAALGVVQIILQNDLRLSLSLLIKRAVWQTLATIELETELYERQENGTIVLSATDVVEGEWDDRCYYRPHLAKKVGKREDAPDQLSVDDAVELGSGRAIAKDLLAFFHDRLTQYLRDQGHRHDRIAAALRPGEDDLARAVALFNALNAFLSTPEGADLTAAYKRAANILRAEAKRGELPDGAPDPALFAQAEERALAEALDAASARLVQSLDDEDFQSAMSHLAGLRGPLDAFFEAVTVNAEDEGLRANRLRLLGEIKRVCERVADLGKLEG